MPDTRDLTRTDSRARRRLVGSRSNLAADGLLKLATLIHASTDLSEVLRLVRDAVVDRCGFDRAGVFLYDEGRALMKGAWGTDRLGNVEDLTRQEFTLSEDLKTLWGIGGAEPHGYLYVNDYSTTFDVQPDNPMYGVRSYGIVHLQVDGETVGFIAVDNLLTQRTITETDLESLIPFAQQAAIAVHRAKLLDQLSKAVQRKQRLLELTQRINSTDDADSVLRLVQRGVVQDCGFDRASVFVYDRKEKAMCGTWGTDRNGALKDMHGNVFPVDEDSAAVWCISDSSEVPYVQVSDYTSKFELPQDHGMYGVRHFALVHLRADHEILGFISVDNLFSQRPILRSELEELLPFAEQAAVALHKARLLEEMESNARKEKRLRQIISAINESIDLNTTLALIRRVIKEDYEFDRTALFIYDERRRAVRVGWEWHEDASEREQSSWTEVEGDPARVWGYGRIGPNGYVYTSNYTDEFGIEPEQPMYGVREHALIHLQAHGQTIGFLTVDNHESSRPFSEDDVLELLPVADEAALAIHKAWLIKRQATMLAQQKSLLEMSAAISADQQPERVCRLVRDALVESGVVDRAGIWIRDGDDFVGTWGTDLAGNPVSEQDERIPMSRSEASLRQIRRATDPHAVLSTRSVSLADGSVREGVHGAVIALRASGDLVGIIIVDTLFTMRPLAYEALEPLFPFAEQAAVALLNAKLKRQVLDHMARLEESQAEVLERLARAAAYKDDITGAHTERMRDYCFLIGRSMGLDDSACDVLRRASQLHDLGKIGIPEHILNKPGKLTDEEFAIVRRHPSIGEDLLAGGRSELIRVAEEIAASHHERWDGRGYPKGLSGEEIPLFARIVSVADVLDALINDRPYKSAWNFEDAIDEVRRGSGTQFDERVVEALLQCLPLIKAVHEGQSVLQDKQSIRKLVVGSK